MSIRIDYYRNNKPKNCRMCGAPITFDDRKMSKNSKKIPLNYHTRLTHECSIEENDKQTTLDLEFKN
jgi:hypothetical protein